MNNNRYCVWEYYLKWKIDDIIYEKWTFYYSDTTIETLKKKTTVVT